MFFDANSPYFSCNLIFPCLQLGFFVCAQVTDLGFVSFELSLDAFRNVSNIHV